MPIQPTIINDLFYNFFLLLPLERAIKRAGTWFAGTCQYTICCSHLSDRVGIPLPLGDTSPPTPQRRQILGQVTPETWAYLENLNPQESL